MTQTQFRWLFLGAAVVAVAWIFFTLPAKAEWPEGAFTCRAYRADLAWQYWAERHCGRRWRHWRGHHYVKPAPNPDVMSAQVRLQHLGYQIDADGYMGSETREALTRFQHENGLPVTGELDRATKYMLNETNGKGRVDEKAWARRPEICREENGRECTCEPIIVFSGEHVGRDAEGEALKRWRGHVRSMLGETWMSWEKAAGPKIKHCWFTGTGERTTDKLGQTRCVVQARACFGPPAPQDETYGSEVP